VADYLPSLLVGALALAALKRCRTINRMFPLRIAPAYRVGGAFRALLANVHPGLKPWANLCYRFAVKQAP
ncbi:MAG TPA: hypothetical protein VE641_07560, partial [Chthoniobacterales bacterium]|nr:hypothetical protein [Chthoniobacterales bacterium]